MEKSSLGLKLAFYQIKQKFKNKNKQEISEALMLKGGHHGYTSWPFTLRVPLFGIIAETVPHLELPNPWNSS